MAGKDFNERQVFADAFPQAKLLICLFHTLRTFRKEVTVEKMVISVGQRTHALEMFQKMAYLKSIEDYDGYCTDLKSSSPRSVVSYYDSNWHPIREQWVMCMKNSSGNFLNNTNNNRLESINQKKKSVLTKHGSLAKEFTKYFISLLKTLRNEHDHDQLECVEKVKLFLVKMMVNPLLILLQESYWLQLTLVGAHFVKECVFHAGISAQYKP